MEQMLQGDGLQMSQDSVRQQNSFFDGSTFGLLFVNIGSFLLVLLTITLAQPWARCMKERWYAKHTVYNGNRCYFDGTGGQLFFKNILWNFLTIITLGIFLIFRKNRMRKWVTKHTHFEIAEFVGDSRFTGSTMGLFFTGVLAFVVSVITFGLGFCAMTCWRQRWMYKHTIIDGQQIDFDGKGLQLFGKLIVWVLLSIITLGIYFLFLLVKIKKWKTKHAYIKALGLTIVTEDSQYVEEFDLEERAIKFAKGIYVFSMIAFLMLIVGITIILLGVFYFSTTGLIQNIEIFFIGCCFIGISLISVPIAFILAIKSKSKLNKSDCYDVKARKRSSKAVVLSSIMLAIFIIINILSFAGWLYPIIRESHCEHECSLDDGYYSFYPHCTQENREGLRCDKCGVYFEVVILPVGHIEGYDYIANSQTHWHECVFCGEKMDEEEHYYGPFSNKCNDCGAQKN